MNVVFRTWTTRSLIALCCGAWVGAWVVTLAGMDHLETPQRYLGLIALLVLIQAISRRWLRIASSVVVVVVGLLQYSWMELPSPKTPTSWWKAESEGVINLLVHHWTSPVLTATLFGLIFSILFGLLLYSSQYARLWLFYQALALFAFVMIHINTSAVVTPALLIVLAVAAIGVALLSYERIAREDANGISAIRFLIPVLSALTAILPICVFAPKPTVQWRMLGSGPSFIPFSTSSHAAPPLGPTQLNRVGFQAGGQALGGSISPDDLPVLSVIAPNPAYLRGQVLETYTGHTWQPGSAHNTQSLANGATFALTANTFHGLSTQTVTQYIRVLGGGLNSDLVLGAYSMASIRGFKSHLSINPATATVFTNHVLSIGQSYSVTSLEPVSPYGYLERDEQPVASLPSSMATLVSDLALPSSFPHRDVVLARTITRRGTSEYQKVTLVEQYLEAHERYATTHIPVPGPGQDYVDQFLFETHRGYCNNFSTAMAVLLRSVGIPTRWVTGFASGTVDETYTGPMNRYVIRDSDAHSWVEVYFQGVGWIPFDPTPGHRLSFPTASSPGVQSPSAGGGTHNQVGTPPSSPPSTPSQPAGGATGGSHLRRSTLFWPATSKWIALVILGICGSLLTLAWTVMRFRRRHAVKVQSRRSSTAGDNHRASELAKLVQAVVTANLDSDWTLGRGATIRHFTGSATAAGLSADEFGRFVRFVEQLWYSQTPLGDEEHRELAAMSQRWLGAMRSTKRRT